MDSFVLRTCAIASDSWLTYLTRRYRNNFEKINKDIGTIILNFFEKVSG